MKCIKQSQIRSKLLKGNGIERFLNLIAWRRECDEGRLNIHWNAIERVLPIKSPKGMSYTYMADSNVKSPSTRRRISSTRRRFIVYIDGVNVKLKNATYPRVA